MSAPLAVAAEAGDGRWRWPIDPGRYDTAPAVRAAEAAAIAGLGVEPAPPGPPRPGRRRVAADPAAAAAAG